MNACWTINRKTETFRIYNTNLDYRLRDVKEYKLAHDMTYQQVADHLLAQHEGSKNET